MIVFKIIKWIIGALIICVILAIGYMVIKGKLAYKKSRKMAALTTCTKCNSAFGFEAVDDVTKRFSDKIIAHMKKGSGGNYKLRVEWEIICPHCHHHVSFFPDGNQMSEKTD